MAATYATVSLDGEKRLAYDREYRSWVKEEAFVRVSRDSVEPDANIIGSPTIYKRKNDGRMKARIVPWEYLDDERNHLRSDLTCVNLEIFRIVSSLAAENSWVVGQMDISTAYLKAQGSGALST